MHINYLPYNHMYLKNYLYYTSVNNKIYDLKIRMKLLVIQSKE